MAEILELHENRSGHCYLELVEKAAESEKLLARARAVIWASRYSMLRPYFETSTGTRLKSGIKLLVKASVEFHELYSFSLQITDIDPAYTLGDLAMKKQEVIRKLREAGIMDMNRELPFPLVPLRIAVISSEGAAGYGDFMESLHQNPHGFSFHTTLFPAVMQGEESPASLTGAMDKVFESVSDFDCVVLIRGGGSKADLEPYNDYELAFHITQFPLPVITGIGHERDESVADMVAAAGLKTPTAVAEFLIDRVLSFEFSLTAFDDRLKQAVGRIVQVHGSRLERQGVELFHFAMGLIRRRSEWLDQAAVGLEKELHTLMNKKRDHLHLLETRAQLVHPERILKRGYSMTMKKGKVVTRASEVKRGDELETRVHRGTLYSRVERNRE